MLKSSMTRHRGLPFGKKVVEETSVFLWSVAIFVVLSFWAAFNFQIDKIVRVEGKIIPTGHNRPIQHLEGGIVSEISTHEGAVVKEGDLLLTIDATAAGASFNENKVKLMSQQAKAARLKAEAERAAAMILPPHLADIEAGKEERQLFLSLQNSIQSNLRVSQETIRQHQAALDEIDSRRKNLEDECLLAQKRSQMLEKMAAQRAASQIELLEAQSRERRLETEIKDAESTKPKIRAALTTEQAKAASMLAEFKSQAQADLVTTLAEIDRLNQTITAAADRVKRTEIRAPIDGIINRIAVTSIGSVVKSGEAIIELTPLSNEIVLEAKVMPQDRGELRLGLEAKVRVSAYDHATLGAVSGKLAEISADTMQEAKGEAYYRAKIVIDHLPDSYRDRPLTPGMTVTSDLISGQRTFANYLLSPLLKFSHNTLRDAR